MNYRYEQFIYRGLEFTVRDVGPYYEINCRGLISGRYINYNYCTVMSKLTPMEIYNILKREDLYLPEFQILDLTELLNIKIEILKDLRPDLHPTALSSTSIGTTTESYGTYTIRKIIEKQKSKKKLLLI